EGGWASPSLGNPRAPAWAARFTAPAKGQAGARGFVDGQIREVNAETVCARPGAGARSNRRPYASVPRLDRRDRAGNSDRGGRESDHAAPCGEGRLGDVDGILVADDEPAGREQSIGPRHVEHIGHALRPDEIAAP